MSLANRYLKGARALAMRGHAPSVVQLASMRPLSAGLARQIIGACLGVLAPKVEQGDATGCEAARQLVNMDTTIEERQLDPLPSAAAELLGQAAEAVIDEFDDVDNEEPGNSSDWPAYEEVPTSFPIDWEGTFQSTNIQPGEGFTVLGSSGRAVVGVLEAIGARTKQTLAAIGVADNDEADVEDAYDGHSFALLEGIGMYDIASAKHQMDSLKLVSVSAAQALLKGGQNAINHAIQISNDKGLPGPTERKNVQAHLQWHADHLAALTRTPNAMYPSGDDLKKYVMMAFVDSNAVDEGAAYLDQIWDLMWQEIATAIAALPAEVRKAASNVVQNVTGLPLWGWGLIGAGIVGILGYGVYKVASGPAGGAVVRHYLR